jgi:RNA polymerase sigma-32 factor
MEIFNEKLKEFRKQLDNRDKYILDKRILAKDPKTFQQIGEKFNISRERSRQVEEKIIRKLREYIREEIPDLESLDIEF